MDGFPFFAEKDCDSKSGEGQVAKGLELAPELPASSDLHSVADVAAGREQRCTGQGKDGAQRPCDSEENRERHADRSDDQRLRCNPNVVNEMMSPSGQRNLPYYRGPFDLWGSKKPAS